MARDEVCLPAQAARLPPLRVAFASDFYAGSTTDSRAVAEACAALAALEPDLLRLGGDYVSLNARSIEPLAALLGRIPARLGRFAVLSNHDLWADDYPIVRRLQAASVEVLLNAGRRLPAPYDHLWLCGLDDPTSGQPDVTKTFDGPTGVHLVLMHSPEGLGLLDGVRFELALSDHTHGGQIALPGGRPLWVPPGRWNWRYPVGRHRLAGHGRRASSGLELISPPTLQKPSSRRKHRLNPGNDGLPRAKMLVTSWCEASFHHGEMFVGGRRHSGTLPSAEPRARQLDGASAVPLPGAMALHPPAGACYD